MGSFRSTEKWNGLKNTPMNWSHAHLESVHLVLVTTILQWEMPMGDGR